jgi:hypothetical protein
MAAYIAKMKMTHESPESYYLREGKNPATWKKDWPKSGIFPTR